MQILICKSFVNVRNNNCLFHLLVAFNNAPCNTYQRKITGGLCFNYTTVENKKAHPIQSDELQYFDKTLSVLSDLSSPCGDGIGTFSPDSA